MTTRNALVESHLSYARAAASRFTKGAPRTSTEWQDAYSTAYLALVEAADIYEPERGTKFITIAWRRMEWAIKNERVRGGLRKKGRAFTGNSEAAQAQLDNAMRSDETPETLYVSEEERAAGAARLKRALSVATPEQKEIIESVLEGRPANGNALRHIQAQRIALAAGVNVKVQKRERRLTQAERQKRYEANWSPEQKERRREQKRVAAQRRRARLAEQGVAA